MQVAKIQIYKKEIADAWLVKQVCKKYFDVSFLIFYLGFLLSHYKRIKNALQLPKFWT